MARKWLLLAVAGIALLPLASWAAGGWAVITVVDLPEHVVAGQPFQLSYVVRQHGVSPRSFLPGRVSGTGGASTAGAAGRWDPDSGRYIATMTLPTAGRWTLTIHSGFMDSKLTLLPLPAVAQGAAAPPRPTQADRGRHLFVAKGCATCHVYRGVSGSTIAGAPELGTRRLAPEYLERVLTDPDQAFLGRRGTFTMPKLELRGQEIAALIAFLNREGAVAGR